MQSFRRNVVNFGNDNIRSEARFKVIVVGCLFMVHGTCIYFVLIYACMQHSCIHACKGNCIIYTYICMYTPKTSLKIKLNENVET